MIRHAISARSTGSVIVTASHDDESKFVLVTAVERFGADVGPLVERVLELVDDDPECQGVVDSKGLGGAVVKLLTRGGIKVRNRGAWREFDVKKSERTALVNTLVVAQSAGTFRFGPGIAAREAVTDALLALKRADAIEDVPNAELVIALSLALDDFRVVQPALYIAHTAEVEANPLTRPGISPGAVRIL